MPSVGAPAWWVKLASDPESNQILCATLDDQNDINVNVWSGSSWGSNSEVSTSAPGYDTRFLDLAYEPEGTKALLAYVESGSTSFKYRTWSGSAWSSEATGIDLGNQGRTIQLRTGTGSREIFFAASDDGEDIELARWTGSWSTKTKIEDNMGALPQCESFMIAPPTAGALTPASIPYTQTFESTVGSEWSSSSTTNDTTLSKYAGPYYNNSSLRLALNTTIGETYVLYFDFYAFDTWDGNDATYGPDAFTVAVDSTQAFNYTFTNEFPNYGATYPYPPDQTGNYELNSNLDGVYRKVEVVFKATSSVTTLTFAADVVEAGSEAWGIDNVNVKKATFIDVSAATNFDVQVTNDGSMSAGIHWADLDNDGDLDAILAGGNTSRLMKFNWSSQDYTVSTFGGGGVREQGAIADFDNDGDIDFWSCEVGSDGVQKMYTNNGSGVFSDAGACGFSGAGTNEGCAAVDTNRNGWCDLVVFSDNANWVGVNQMSSSPAFVATKSSSYGLNTAGDFGARGDAASGDVNNDGILDFFYRYNNGRLFISSGSGSWTQNPRGISVLTGGSEDLAAAWGDYNNDGKLDLFVPRLTEGYTGSLWRNDVTWSGPSGNFTDVTSSAGLNLNGKTVPTTTVGSRSGCWGDYDNDGDLDLFIVGANGNCLLYQNQGGGVFTRVAVGTKVSGSCHDAVFVDYDNDGDLDLCITRESAACILLENRTNNSNYLKVRLVGRGSGGTNKAAIGTRVELWNSAGTTLLARRDVGIARGYGGTEPLWVHFGGVTPSTSYTVKAYFNTSTSSQTVTPNAVSTTIGSRTISQMLTITESTKTSIVRWSEVLNHP
jgi:hypothetical protein